MRPAVAKTCVFCGNAPEDKTKEHVIPKWMLRMSGQENREAFFGVRYSEGPEKLAVHRHAFGAYTFPACASCNATFAQLEYLAKGVFEKLLSESTVSASEVEILFDWLDKVRVGLWLAGRMLGTNIFRAANPRFAIADRIGLEDRWAKITLLPESVGEGLTYSGVGSPLFGSMPSAFALRINRLVILNASSGRLVTRSLGLPYPETKRFRTPDGPYYQTNVSFGKKRILPNMMDFGSLFGGLEVFQPAYPFLLKHCEKQFRNEYAERFFVDLETLRAKPLLKIGRDIKAIDNLGAPEFERMRHQPDESFPNAFSRSSLILQNYVSKEGFYGGPPISQRQFEKQQTLARQLRGLNKTLLRMMARQVAAPSMSNDGSAEMDKGLRVFSI